ncbi:related to KEI1 - component of inositol phosphorylceramide synthase [Ustilago sp. UG-2017b]|nr:related to KEI1 - component of inositol phosphorylceramide synthase [Ustilago sp. UG-2017b]
MSRLYLRLPSVPSFHHAITSFLGFMDLKIGASILTLFALFNKTAGVYGILAVFQGGTFSQVALYVYSIATIVLFLWGLKGISDEDAQYVLTYAHLFTLDHMVSTFWTLLFTFNWWYFTPHDGQPTTNQSSHQTGLMDLIETIESQYRTPEQMAQLHHDKLTPEQRKTSAQRIWKEEKDFSAAVLILGWLVKIYFALVLYSYALHLRHGTYRALPLSKASSNSAATRSGAGRSEYRYHPVVEEEELENWSDDGEADGDAQAAKGNGTTT